MPAISSVSDLGHKEGAASQAVSDVLKVYDDALQYINAAPLEPSKDMPDNDAGGKQLAPIQDPPGSLLTSKPPVSESLPALTQQKAGVNMRQETFVLDTGEVTIQWPSKMTGASFEDFSDWLEILKRKVKRSVEESDKEQKSENASQE